ncbi:MAG: nuclear transport factor 2 family protein [Hyphomonadaceae bacterium]
MRALIAAVCLAVCLAAYLGEARAEAPPARGDAATIAVAEAYMEAYQALDLPRLEALYTEDADFIDLTSLRAVGVASPYVWNGREALMAGLRTWTPTVRAIPYTYERIFEASGFVVFIGAANPIIAVEGGGDAQYRYPIVTIIQVEDGRIREHRDYTDYAGAALVPED